MNDTSISTSRLITATLWVLAGLTFAAAWVAWWATDHELAVMIATTGVLPLGAAATSQVRCYTLRVCGLLRATGGFERERTPELHSLR